LLAEADTLWAELFFIAPNKNLPTITDGFFQYVSIVRDTHVLTPTSTSLDVDGACSDLLGDELIGCNGDEGGELSNSNASCASRPLTQSSSSASFVCGCSSITGGNDWLLD
jgi:hypothetical protein